MRDRHTAAGFVMPDLVGWLVGGWACIVAVGAVVFALWGATVPVALPEVERPYVECDRVPFYGSLGECIGRGGQRAAVVWWQPEGMSR